MPEPSINIENVVASVVINQRLDLHKIEQLIPGATFNPDKFPGLILKLKEPKTALLIFSSGKFVCTGAKSAATVAKAVNKVIEMLNARGIKITGKPLIKVENIVASAKLHVTVDLERASVELEGTVYEPEQFPGMILRMENPNVVFLVFSSGSLVCTGAKKEEDVYKAVYKLRRILAEKGLIISVALRG
ncbi:MAG: TATA-box-binding protein [Thermoproteota archaeon]|nr:MAG: TATA-box-binding protein [Candidatus Korarchaeota archaeon]RLG56098.1 MAG: TATA-box-binding protein [Candidatus Korarchaeota archaeon]